jgi:hypothetical protein
MMAGAVGGSQEDLTGRLDPIMERLDRSRPGLASKGRPASTAGALTALSLPVRP